MAAGEGDALTYFQSDNAPFEVGVSWRKLGMTLPIPLLGVCTDVPINSLPSLVSGPSFGKSLSAFCLLEKSWVVPFLTLLPTIAMDSEAWVFPLPLNERRAPPSGPLASNCQGWSGDIAT